MAVDNSFATLQPGRPIFDRKRLPACGNHQPATAKPAPAQPTAVEDFYLELAIERGTRLDVRFMNGDELRGCGIVAAYKYAIVLRDSNGGESYCFKHGIARVERAASRKEP